MNFIFVVGFLVLILHNISGLNEHKVEEVYKWSKIEYEYLPKSEISLIGPYRYYIPENNNIGSFGYHPASGLILVTIDRLRPGVPTSLGAFCVSDYTSGVSPKIWGFPSYQINDLHAIDFLRGTEEEKGIAVWNKPADPIQAERYYSDYYYGRYPHLQQIPYYENQNFDRIISVFHITIDERCNRVFFMDNGQVQYYQNATYAIQRPVLWVVDLSSNGCETRNFPIVRRAELPNHIAAKGSNGFVHVTLDYQSDYSCDDLFVYITNTFFNYLVVYDYKNNEFWSFDHQTFQPVVSESYFIFDKTFNYQMNMGLYSISLGYPDQYGDRMAYYTPEAGTAQYGVSTKVLKDRNSVVPFNSDDFRIMGYRGCNHQSFKTVIDLTYGVMFYSEIQSNQIRCWNIKNPLNPDYIGVVYESDTFDAGLQMFIDSHGYLWFYSSQIPIILSSDYPQDFSRLNNIILRIKVFDAIRGTVCENGSK